MWLHSNAHIWCTGQWSLFRYVRPAELIIRLEIVARSREELWIYSGCIGKRETCQRPYTGDLCEVTYSYFCSLHWCQVCNPPNSGSSRYLTSLSSVFAKSDNSRLCSLCPHRGKWITTPALHTATNTRPCEKVNGAGVRKGKDGKKTHRANRFDETLPQIWCVRFRDHRSQTAPEEGSGGRNGFKKLR